MFRSFTHSHAQLQSSLWRANASKPVPTFAAEGPCCARGTMQIVLNGLGKKDRIPGAPT